LSFDATALEDTLFPGLLSPEHQGVIDSGAKLLRRVTAEKDRLSSAVYDLQEALQQELARRQCLQEYKDDLEQQLQNERQLAMEEKERMMECMWAEKQALLRAMAGLGREDPDASELEASLRDRVEKIRVDLCQDKNALQQQLRAAQQELARLRATQEAQAAAAAPEPGEGDKAALLQRIRELEARCATAAGLESQPDAATVRKVMDAVGSGCTEATARRLLAACANDFDKAVGLASRALDALHKSWEHLEGDASRSLGSSMSKQRPLAPGPGGGGGSAWSPLSNISAAADSSHLADLQVQDKSSTFLEPSRLDMGGRPVKKIVPIVLPVQPKTLTRRVPPAAQDRGNGQGGEGAARAAASSSAAGVEAAGAAGPGQEEREQQQPVDDAPVHTPAAAAARPAQSTRGKTWFSHLLPASAHSLRNLRRVSSPLSAGVSSPYTAGLLDKLSPAPAAQHEVPTPAQTPAHATVSADDSAVSAYGAAGVAQTPHPHHFGPEVTGAVTPFAGPPEPSALHGAHFLFLFRHERDRHRQTRRRADRQLGTHTHCALPTYGWDGNMYSLYARIPRVGVT